MKLEEQLRSWCEGFPLHSQAKVPNPVVCAKLYWPIGKACWYIVGYNPEAYVAYGFVTGIGDDDWGYFSVLDLLEAKIASIAPIELDEDFEPTPASALGIGR